MLVQSNAIARTCARWCGLAGKSCQEMEQADEAHECLRDIFDSSIKILWESCPERKVRSVNNFRVFFFNFHLIILIRTNCWKIQRVAFFQGFSDISKAN